MNAPTTVAVRELCEFTAKRGDLDLRFTPAPTAEEGIAGHGIVTRRRGEGYQREVRLETVHGDLRLRGRADGLRLQPLTLEEIKTHRGDLARQPGNHRGLHWAQLKIYGAQLCEQQSLQSLRLSLVYFDVDRQKETAFTEDWTREALSAFYREHCERFLDWDRQERAHRARRDAAITAAAFPHPEFHAGQRQLSEAVYRSIVHGRHLLAQAPTGIGKSIGTLFPALKAMAGGRLDKIFYLTAKTSGRRAALDALASLRTPTGAIPLRLLELTARDKACVHPDKACHGESCPLAKGFYDRLPAARAEAVAGAGLQQAELRQVAQRHGICPYYLAQDLVRWADVVVGDYNYYFDRSALLHGLTEINQWRVAVLVDEAHNLVDRGRSMYSAELDQQALAAVKQLAPPKIRRALTKALTAWNQRVREQTRAYQAHETLPLALVEACRKVAGVMSEHFAEHPADIHGELQGLYFDLLGFLDLAESFAEHSIFDVSLLPGRRPRSRIALRNVVPASFLSRRLSAAATVAAFSATLHPFHYYRDLLGFAEDTPCLDVPSPFRAEQLRVRCVTSISTRFERRAQSIAPICELIARQFHQQPGNYLAFFSSYDYLQQVAGALAATQPQLPLWLQDRRMSEAERDAFLARFTEEGQGVGLAVLGGAFAEGVDLPGRRLIGAFIATLGLPQFNPVNEQLLRCMQQTFGDDRAYTYTYLYPGLQKVVQAAGRIIRGPEDRGSVFLIDDRFARPEVLSLLPAWWQVGVRPDGAS